MSKEPQKFSFGPTKPLFGAVDSTGGTSSLFNSGANTPTTSGSGLFGNSTAAAPSGSNLFGSKNTPASTGGGSSSSVFGAVAGNTTTPSFNFGQSKPASPAPPTSAVPSMFGQKPAVSPAGTSGEPAKLTSGPSLFSTPPSTAGGGPSAQSSFNFGQSNTPATSTEQSKPNTTQSMFTASNTTSAAAPPGTGLFGSAASTTPQANKQAAPLSFTPAGNPPTSIFGDKSKQPQQTQGQTSGLTFKPAIPAQGNQTTASAQASKPTFSFTNSNSVTQPTPQQQPTPSLFAPNTTAQGQSATTATSGTSASSLFPAASKPAPATGGFTLSGQSSASTLPVSTGVAALTSAAPAGGLGGSLFPPTNPSAPASTSAPQAQTNTSTAGTTASLFGTSTTTGGLGASTSGPQPSQQSRLHGKTMDDILTMWSTSLATHQKTFQALAERVSAWDRRLTENSSQISALYGRCFQAEHDCKEVERQLGLVERGQAELDGMLERYEGEVDRMLEGAGLGDGGMGVGGVDAERERTYKSAEQCAGRLTEMSHSLTEMIEEINAASSRLSSGGNSGGGVAALADDPLSEIVRVLNGHLAQLQMVDQGASALAAKVQEAQHDASELRRGSVLNGEAERWVNDFGRSYLGRR